jgi:hypothetical protein
MSRWLSKLKEAPPSYETSETPRTPRSVGFVASPGRVSERSEGSTPKAEPEPSSTEDRLREIARAHSIDWMEARRWMRLEDVAAAEPYLNSDDERDRQGVVTWLRLLADPAIVKIPPERIDAMQRRPN